MSHPTPRRFLPLVRLFSAIGISLVLGSASASPFEDAVRATVKLSGENTAATGFVVKTGESYLIATAAHVFRDLKGETCRVILRKKQGNQPSLRMEIELTIRNGEKPLWEKHPKHDLACIPFEMPENADLKPFELKQIAPKEVAEKGIIGVGSGVCIPCYPAKTEGNKAGWPILRRGTIASHPLTPLAMAETFFIDSSSFGGESGAPVVAWEGGKIFVIGVVTGMQRQTDRTKTPLRETTTHTPLGLGIAVQSPFLRELMAD